MHHQLRLNQNIDPCGSFGFRFLFFQSYSQLGSLLRLPSSSLMGSVIGSILRLPSSSLMGSVIGSILRVLALHWWVNTAIYSDRCICKNIYTSSPVLWRCSNITHLKSTKQIRSQHEFHPAMSAPLQGKAGWYLFREGGFHGFLGWALCTRHKGQLQMVRIMFRKSYCD